MPALSNPQHELYARARAKGFTMQEAYAKARYADGHNNAYRLEVMPDVAARVQELIASNRELGDMSRQEMIDFLTEVVSLPVSKVNADSRIAQEVEEIANGDQRRRKVKACDKLRALELLSKITGRLEPDRVQVAVGATIEAIVDKSLLEQLTKGYMELRQVKDKE